MALESPQHLYPSDVPDTSRFSCYRQTTLNTINVLHFPSACSVLNHFTFTPLVLLETYWWWPCRLREQMSKAERSTSLPELHREWVLAPWLTPRSVWPQSQLLPHQPVLSLWTTQQVLWRFLLFLYHVSEVHSPLPELHKRPITPASDLLPWSAPLPSAELPGGPGHRSFQLLVFATLSAQTPEKSVCRSRSDRTGHGTTDWF